MSSSSLTVRLSIATCVVHAAGLLLLFVWRRRAAGEHAAVDGGKSVDDGSLDGKVLMHDSAMQPAVQLSGLVHKQQHTQSISATPPSRPAHAGLWPDIESGGMEQLQA